MTETGALDARQPTAGLILALTIRGLAVGDYPTMSSSAQLAERAGFDSVWLCDHFLTLSADDYVKDAGIASGTAKDDAPKPRSIPLLECWTALSALSRDTERVRLGTSVLCNSYRYPAVLAKMAATLDVISNGRVDLGIGAGWFEQEFRAFGIPFPGVGDRVSALEESLQIIRSVWTDEDPRFEGTFYSIDGAVCDPPPVQQPHPPIWVGGEGERVHRIAARHANGVNVRWWDAERCAERRTYLDAELEKADRDPSSFGMSVTCLLAPTKSASESDAIRERFASIPSTGLIVGSPDECLDTIASYVESGTQDFLFTVPDLGASDYLDTICDSIMPSFHSLTGDR